MPGSDWDRMVAAPSDVEMASALAEVRVRAIGHSVRQGKRRRLVSALALFVIGVVSAYAGRATAGFGAASTLMEAPEPELLYKPAGYEFVPGPVRRFHITTWGELDGVRMNEAEGWVEGPAGTSFQIIRNFLKGKAFTGTVTVDAYGDTTVFNVWTVTRTVLGQSRPSTLLVRESRAQRSIRLLRGQLAVLYPFGLARHGDEPLVVIRIDGPYAPLPDLPVRWQLPDTSRWVTGEDPPFLKRLARANGVRFALRNVGPLILRPRYTPPPRRFRFTLWGRAPSVAVLPQSPPFVIPGVADSVRLRTYHNGWGDLCFQVVPAEGRARAFADGCLPQVITTGVTRVEVTTAQGQRLLVEGIAP